MVHTPVLIVGAGPVGLALAGDLGWRGVRCLLVERTDGTITQPKMDLVGVRTMEFCRRWGIVDAVESSPYPRDYPQDYVYVTSMTGYELGREPFPCLDEEERPPFSPQKRERCPQDMFDPILREFASSQPSVELRYETEVVDLVEKDDLVEVTLRDLRSGRTVTMTADYVVGCDGGASLVREKLGIPMTGLPALTYTTNAILRSESLPTLHDKGLAYRFICIGPEGTFATLVAINGADRWRLSYVGDDVKRKLSEQEMADLARRVVGVDFDFEVLSVVPWVRRELVADRYGTDRVFIAGDAAHLMSPTGGFGMNTGIADAVDLSWKLDAVLNGWGGSQLLRSYTEERQPVGHRNVKEATRNLRRMLGPRENRPPAVMFSDTTEGAEARRRFGADYEDAMRPEWFSADIHLGFVYESSVVVPGPEPRLDPLRPPAESHTPTARPGARAPHAWIAPDTSTLDLFGRGFVLLRLGSEPPTTTELEQAAKELGVPLTVHDVDDPRATELYASPLVLVRPDGHVAWRGDTDPADADAIIRTVTGNRTLEAHPGDSAEGEHHE